MKDSTPQAAPDCRRGVRELEPASTGVETMALVQIAGKRDNADGT